MKMKKKKMSTQSGSKTISEVTTTEAAAITIIEATEVGQVILTPVPIEEANNPPSTGATQTEEEILTEEIEEEALNKHSSNHQISKDKNQRRYADIVRNQDTQLITAGLYRLKTRPEE